MNKIERVNHNEKSHNVHSPNFLEYSSYLEAKKKRIQKNLVAINQSVLSTRDHSLNRNLTPTGGDGHKLKPFSTRPSKNAQETVLKDMKQQLETLFESLPKIPKSFNIQKKHKREFDGNFPEKKTEFIRGISSVYSPNRSKSTITTNKKHLPRIKKEVTEINDLQKYLIEFHSKSKFLLGQLEQNVLGKKSFN